MKLLIFFSWSIILFSACQNQQKTNEPQEEKQNNLIYFETEKAAWSCQYPEGWGTRVEVPTKEEQTALLFLEKDEFNFLTSVVEPFDSSAGSFQKLNESTATMLNDFYTNEEHSATIRTQEIELNHKKFYVIDAKVLKAGKIFMQQTLYNSLLNDTTSISIRISHNNKKDKAVLKNVVHSSTFGS